MTQLRPGCREAAAITWDWKDREVGARSPAAASARVRGGVQALVGLTVGAVLLLLGSKTLGSVVLAIATFILLSAALSPTVLYATIDRGFRATGRVIGSALTWLLLPLLFYGFFLPFGLLFRRGRRDPMRRFYDATATTYWEDHETGRSASGSAERQY